MFRQFAASYPGGAELLFRLHPIELSGLLEQAWEFRQHEDDKPLGHPNRRSDIPGVPDYFLREFEGYDENLATFTRTGGAPPPGAPSQDPAECLAGCAKWNHLIYAFCIEQTGVYEVFRRVLHEFRHGEELGVPLEGSEHWLRNTEEVFFRDPAPFFIHSLTSMVRPNPDGIRRNAYYRMFGMDLTHSPGGDKSFSYVKAKAANNEFVTTFEEFLREVWIGIVHVNNQSGAKPTDDSEIANHAEKLHDMLRTRRISGNLAREEFFAVAAMSWFHLTLESNSRIVLSLRAEGASPEQRLFKLAERAKVPAHALAKNFFDMADAISRILIQLETGIYNDVGAVPALYTAAPGPAGAVERDIRTIITHWSLTTGRDLKSRRVLPVKNP
jgi:hypothetical protein